MNLSIARTYTDPAPPEQVLEDLLRDRTIEDIETFLNPLHPMDITFESLFPDAQTSWKKTIDLLKKIHESQKTIVVYTDYDADGVTGGAIMWEALHKMGFKVMPYVPARSEGYGFSQEGIERVIAEHDPALVISVDHGIVAHNEIAYARSRKVPIIVTDHHHKQGGDPAKAFAVFHTTEVSGAGVAYFVARQILQEMGSIQQHDHLLHMFRSDYLGLAAIGTIADLIPLMGPARSLARYGLPALTTTPRMGIRNLIRDAGIPPQQPITAYHVGYMLAPRINAFGRLEHAMDALRLLCTTSYDRAVELSKQANTINTERQKRVKEAVAQAEKMVNPEDHLIILDSDTWEEGIIGLIAGKMLQTFHRPTIVMTRSSGHAKASVRSIDGVHITDFLKDLKDHLVDMGGHAAAAGFTIKTENIDDFVKAARTKARADIPKELFVPTIHVDIAMPLSMARLQLAMELSKLGPFGMGFKEPTFLSRGAITNIRTMGKTNSHMKIELTATELGSHSSPLECIIFNTPDHMLDLGHGDEVQVIYTLDINSWNGRQSVQGLVKELVLG